jgi:hypothetical protein
MTTSNALLQDDDGANPARGDTVAIVRTVTGVPTGDTLATAWFTVKSKTADLDAAAIMSLEITSVETDNGQITDTGADQTGAVRFVILPADYGNVEAGKNYHYDIQVLTTDGVLSTLEVGRVTWQADVTLAES